MKDVLEYRLDRADVVSFADQSGFFRAKVKLTKPVVYNYLLADGSIRREAKLPDDVFSPAFLQSLDGAIVTDEHPYQVGGLVNSENYNSLMKGIITNPRIEDGVVVADETIFDSALIAKIKSGEKREVSVGMTTLTNLESGLLNGQVYDSAQKNMRANHVAHVVKGRVPDSKIVLDGMNYGIQQGEISMADTVVESEPSWLNGFMDKMVEKIGSAFKPKETVVSDSADSVKHGFDPFDKLRGDQLTMTPSVSESNAVYEKKIADLENTVKSLTSGLSVKLDEAVARDGIVDAVKAVLPEANLAGKSNTEIKKTLISNMLPDVKLDSDDLVDVYYNASLELAKAKAKLSPGKVEVKQDGDDIAALKNKRLNLYMEVK